MQAILISEKRGPKFEGKCGRVYGKVSEGEKAQKKWCSYDLKNENLKRNTWGGGEKQYQQFHKRMLKFIQSSFK